MPTVLVYSATLVTTITDVEDRLANLLAQPLGSWGIELKLFRANGASFANTDRASDVTYTITETKHPDTVFVVSDHPNGSFITDLGFLSIIQSKLQSLWVPRQTFHGEGYRYLLNGCEVRAANLFVQGNFKGLMVEIELEGGMTEETLARAKDIVDKCNIPGEFPNTAAVTPIEAALQCRKINR